MQRRSGAAAGSGDAARRPNVPGVRRRPQKYQETRCAVPGVRTSRLLGGAYTMNVVSPPVAALLYELANELLQSIQIWRLPYQTKYGT